MAVFYTGCKSNSSYKLQTFALELELTECSLLSQCLETPQTFIIVFTFYFLHQ